MILERTPDDISLSNLRSALKSMLGKLEVKIQRTESALEGKLQRLDQDGDGVLNEVELRDAMLRVLKFSLSN